MSMQSVIEIQPNMEVFTADAVRVGRVKQVRDNDMLIDRHHGRDVYIPLTFVSRVLDTERRIDLTLTDAAYGDFDWEHPSLL
jgi:hypothetical protein